MSNFLPANTSPTLIYKCQVTAVNPSTMTVNVWVPEAHTEYKGVYVLSSSVGDDYGAIHLPKVDSVGVVALYHRSNMPVFLGSIPPYGFNSTDIKFESIKQGEHHLKSVGGGFVKLDDCGNAIVGAENGAQQFLMNTGKMLTKTNDKIELSNLHRNSLHIEHKDDIISLNKEFEFYQSTTCKRYSTEDILNEGNINWDIVKDILDAAERTLDILVGENSIFARTGSLTGAIAVQRNATESDIDEFSKFVEGLKIERSGIKVKGTVFGEENIVNVEVLNGEDLVAGISINENGGELLGTWKGITDEE